MLGPATDWAASSSVRDRASDWLGSRNWVIALALLVLLVAVCVRAWVFVVHAAHFDSDQAVIGIMGNDLAEARELPWYTYGRRYMLAIGAWLCAPLFVLFGMSIPLLKLPLVLLNFALVGMLWIGLRRTEKTSPMQTLVSILPIALPGVVTSSRLVEQGGGNIEPLVFLVAAFLLRRRPVWLGICFGFAYLNREFTLLGLVALGLMDLVQRRIIERWREQVLTLGVFGVVAAIGRFIGAHSPNYYGPRVELGKFTPDSIPGLFVHQLPMLLGASETSLEAFNVRSTLSVGHGWLYTLLVVWLVGVVAVLGFVRRLELAELDGIATYMILIAGGQSLAFILFSPAALNPMLLRYVLVLLLGAVGVIALAMKRPLLRPFTAAAVGLLSVSGLVDHARLINEYATHPPRDDFAVLARELVERGVRFAEADDYWVAYHVSFLTREQVIVTAPRDERIPRYRELVDQHRGERYRIRDHCDGGVPVARWQLCKPAL